MNVLACTQEADYGGVEDFMRSFTRISNLELLSYTKLFQKYQQGFVALFGSKFCHMKESRDYICKNYIAAKSTSSY